MNPPAIVPSASCHFQERLEYLRLAVRRGEYKAALFDFDGTLSCLRAGWPQVMVQVLWDYWQAAGLSGGEPERTRQQLLQLVLSTNGMPPLRQMQVFVQTVQNHGGAELDPGECAATYQQRLVQLVQRRYDSIRQGRTSPHQWIVPGARDVLITLQQRGVLLFLASGTDYDQVHTEAELLGLLPFFPQAIFAPQGQDGAFSKGRVLDYLLQRYELRGEVWIGFGDGVVETREIKRIGGTAIGLATSEASDSLLPAQEGTVPLDSLSSTGWDDPTVTEKCQRLLAAGADLVLPHYLGLFVE
jgi:phosphoglycolate phosphatase-like HAD superfamily hydrolase